MIPARPLAFLAALALVCACDSTAERPVVAPPPVEPTADAGPAAPTPQPRRTMQVASLFGSVSAESLVVDPNFEGGQFGIGRWLASFSGIFSDNAPGPPLGQTIVSDSPAGVALPVGTVSDIPTDRPPRQMTLIAQVAGGKGPFEMRLWVSADASVGEPDWRPLVRVTLGGGPSGTGGVDIPMDPKAVRTIGDRRWIQFTGHAPGPYLIGAFFIIRLKPSRYHWWLQAPEVIPTVLLPAGASTLERRIEPSARLLEDDELRAIDNYRRQPLRFGPPMPPPFALRSPPRPHPP